MSCRIELHKIVESFSAIDLCTSSFLIILSVPGCCAWGVTAPASRPRALASIFPGTDKQNVAIRLANRWCHCMAMVKMSQWNMADSMPHSYTQPFLGQNYGALFSVFGSDVIWLIRYSRMSVAVIVTGSDLQPSNRFHSSPVLI